METQEGGEWPCGQAQQGWKEDTKRLHTNQQAAHTVRTATPSTSNSQAPLPPSPLAQQILLSASAQSTSSNPCPQYWEGKGSSKTLNPPGADSSGCRGDSYKYTLLSEAMAMGSLLLHRYIPAHFAHQFPFFFFF